MTDEKIIEIEVTAADLEEMKYEGVFESDLPEIGIKRYRPARHVIKDKSKITLLIDSEVLEHFESRAAKNERESCQSRINAGLRRIMERERADEFKSKEKLAA
ncbi:MAG: BrnA antitoxin family protein [Pyrinomonadaceae bacterium]|nr:BrnA antitoxin family protein [Pyrinomonadaceae bacterium]